MRSKIGTKIQRSVDVDDKLIVLVRWVSREKKMMKGQNFCYKLFDVNNNHFTLRVSYLSSPNGVDI